PDGAGDFGGPVGAGAINDYDLVGEIRRAEAAGYRRLLILGNHDQGKARHTSSKTTGDVIEASTMPHPAPPVQPDAERIIFIRQQFSQFGGAELILDRLLEALAARGKRVALLGRAWRERQGVEFIRCDPPKIARAFREGLFARAACQLIAREPGALVQAHERV